MADFKVLGMCLVALVLGGPGTGFSDSLLSADDIRALKAFEFWEMQSDSGKSQGKITGTRWFRHSRGDAFLSRDDVKMLADPTPGRVPDTESAASYPGKKAAPCQGAGDSFLSAEDVKMLNGFCPGCLNLCRF